MEFNLSEEQNLLIATTKTFVKEEVDLNNKTIMTRNKFHQVFSIRCTGSYPDGKLTINPKVIKSTTIDKV